LEALDTKKAEMLPKELEELLDATRKKEIFVSKSQGNDLLRR